MMGRKTSSVSVCVHHSARIASPESGTKNAARYVTISRKISNAIKPDSQESLSPSQRGRTRNRRIKSPRIPTAQAMANAAAKSKYHWPNSPAGLRNPAPKPTAQWFSVTSANAQKPQNTNACAKPGRGRWRMTFAWHITSQTKSHRRFPMGKRWKSGSFFDLRILSRIGAKRRQNSAPDAASKAPNRMRSHREKLCGSASVKVIRTISERTHNTRSWPGSSRNETAQSAACDEVMRGIPLCLDAKITWAPVHWVPIPRPEGN